MKRILIKLLTKWMPFQSLRDLYRYYHYWMAWVNYGDWKFPRIINIEINSHCNRACAYCPNMAAPQVSKLMKPEVLDAVINQLRKLNWYGVVDFIFFNESTLHPKLPEIVRRVKQAAPRCIPRISTNGDLLTADKVQALVDAGMDRIYVMRHNPTPAGWRERIAALDAQFPGTFVLMDIDELEQTGGLHDFNGLVEVKKHRGRHIVDGRARCQVHRHVAQITVDGDWNLCCVDYAKTHTFGNLTQRDFLDIWWDPAFIKMRNGLEDGTPMTKTCETCTCLVERAPEYHHPEFVPRAVVEARQ